jgi:signal transduction histidine kinase
MMNILQQKVNLTHELQAQLVHQEKMAGVGQMGAGLAHEIGNPLASISSLIQMLLKKKEAGDIREKLALVSFHIGRISKIVRQLADFSRPGGLTWGLVNLNDLLKEAVNIVQYDRKASNLTFTLELAEDLPEVFVVADEILQVFFNILQNAVDASSHEGTISIRTWAGEPNVCASFEDKGTGMTAAEMQRIFEPFYTTKEPGKGTGLGLSISYSIVQKHKGKIEVQSQKNRGSTFSVKLPRARERVPL